MIDIYIYIRWIKLFHSRILERKREETWRKTFDIGYQIFDKLEWRTRGEREMDRDISFPEIDRSWRFLCRELAMRVSPPFLYLPLSLSLSLRSIYNEWTEYEFLKFEIIRQTKRYRYSLARRRRNLQVNGDKIKLQNFINFKRVSSWTNNRAITWNG